MCKVGYSTTQFTFILLPPNVLTNYVIYAILLLARYTLPAPLNPTAKLN